MWDLIVSVPYHCLSFYFKLGLSLGARITCTSTYARTHAHRKARAHTPYYHGTQTKTKVDVQ